MQIVLIYTKYHLNRIEERNVWLINANTTTRYNILTLFHDMHDGVKPGCCIQHTKNLVLIYFRRILSSTILSTSLLGGLLHPSQTALVPRHETILVFMCYSSDVQLVLPCGLCLRSQIQLLASLPIFVIFSNPLIGSERVKYVPGEVWGRIVIARNYRFPVFFHVL
jgi:hypothetical protein